MNNLNVGNQFQTAHPLHPGCRHLLNIAAYRIVFRFYFQVILVNSSQNQSGYLIFKSFMGSQSYGKWCFKRDIWRLKVIQEGNRWTLSSHLMCWMQDTQRWWLKDWVSHSAALMRFYSPTRGPGSRDFGRIWQTTAVVRDLGSCLPGRAEIPDAHSLKEVTSPASCGKFQQNKAPCSEAQHSWSAFRNGLRSTSTNFRCWLGLQIPYISI